MSVQHFGCLGDKYYPCVRLGLEALKTFLGKHNDSADFAADGIFESNMMSLFLY